MAHTIEPISETEFKVNNTFVYKDQNNKWVAAPPIESQSVQSAVNNYIQSLSNEKQKYSQRK
jgi:hypothetical protein